MVTNLKSITKLSKVRVYNHRLTSRYYWLSVTRTNMLAYKPTYLLLSVLLN